MTKRMKWPQLLSKKRIGRAKTAEKTTDRSDFQVDYDRIIFSSAFRRLQDKTQVYPLAESDYVRTRLTHTLEVASVGRSLGTMVGRAILQNEAIAGYSADDFGTIVAAGCLAHDIGNPPFGHSGEDAISKWFLVNEASTLPKISVSGNNAKWIDLSSFEGNAQGFRILARLQNYYDHGGMQLTCATLGAFTKYPRASYVGVSNDTLKEKVSSKKYGFFFDDQDLFKEVATATGLIRRNNNHYWWCRHPLSFLVEAADDICNHIIDFEDGFRVGLIDFEEARDRISALLPEAAKPPRDANSTHGKKNYISYLRGSAINHLTTLARDAFIANYDDIMNGTLEKDLMSLFPPEIQEACQHIRSVSKTKLYNSRGVLEIEVAGYRVISNLLDEFINASYDRSPGKTSNKKVRELLAIHGSELLYSYIEPDENEHYRRALQVTDFISGMTDSYIISFYRKIRGIAYPNGLSNS